VLYDSKDLNTHAVIIGMTGSGKTGLGISLLEEALIDNIPVIAIDPKGDLPNLLLNFPQLQPGDFRPWINKQDALNAGLTPDQFAAKQADLWRKGLASWDQDPERIARLKASADFAIYTPGSNAGQPVSVLRNFAPPTADIMAEKDLLRERMFFVAVLLNEILAWMRTQQGTTSLRAVLYMDEIFGYFPPVKNPPSKAPLLTLLKQARAFGLGVVLSTQNPVDLETNPLAGPSFAELPAGAKNPKAYSKWNKDLLRWVRQNRPLRIYRCPRFNLSSDPREARADFMARLAQAAREDRDLQVEKLRRKYSAKFNTLNDRLMRAEQAVMREKEQSQSSKIQTVISFGTAILGAFMGRKAVSVGSAGRFGTAMRSASRVRKESMDVNRAQQTLEATRLQLEELDQRLQEDIEQIEAELVPNDESIQEVLVKPKNSDMTLELFGLVWLPYRRDARGRLAPDWV